MRLRMGCCRYLCDYTHIVRIVMPAVNVACQFTVFVLGFVLLGIGFGFGRGLGLGLGLVLSCPLPALCCALVGCKGSGS